MLVGLTILVNTGVIGTSDQVTRDIIWKPLILPSDMFQSLQSNVNELSVK